MYLMAIRTPPLENVIKLGLLFVPRETPLWTPSCQFRRVGVFLCVSVYVNNAPSSPRHPHQCYQTISLSYPLSLTEAATVCYLTVINAQETICETTGIGRSKSNVRRQCCSLLRGMYQKLSWTSGKSTSPVPSLLFLFENKLLWFVPKRMAAIMYCS